MIVFDLKCQTAGHVFEAWFSSSDAYEDQRGRGLLCCPICGDQEIGKAAMAASVPVKGNTRSADKTRSLAKPGDQEAKALLAVMASAQQKLLGESSWVGRQFDSQARAMDSGEIEKSTIHGEVTADEAKSLVEDGIAVMPLPFPVIPPEKCN